MKSATGRQDRAREEILRESGYSIDAHQNVVKDDAHAKRLRRVTHHPGKDRKGAHVDGLTVDPMPDPIVAMLIANARFGGTKYMGTSAIDGMDRQLVPRPIHIPWARNTW